MYFYLFRARSVFSAITTQYGAQNCYLLKVNSKYDDELTDPWRAHLESKYRGLKKGLRLAKHKVLSKTMGLNDGMVLFFFFVYKLYVLSLIDDSAVLAVSTEKRNLGCLLLQ